MRAIMLAAVLSGCATVSSKDHGSWGRAYSGVRCVGTEDYWAGMDEALQGTKLIYKGTDYLFSAIFDTLLLPADLIAAAVKKPDRTAKPESDLCNNPGVHANGLPRPAVPE